MAKGFGNTWWGEHWLKALAAVDYSNRLPRGATYARTGKVESLVLKDSKLTAKVAGSRKTPYSVSVAVPKFSQKQQQALLNAIMEKPMMVAKLLNRELDSGLLPLASSLGLQVFPRTWDDLEMHCSCPDWAVPCKHLAAAIYMLSREIDNDPFLVFSMHGVDLLAGLERLGMPVNKNQTQSVATLDSILSRQKPLRDSENANSHDAIYRRIDFSALQNIAEPLVQLLPDAPVFYPKNDFKPKYCKLLTRAAKQAERLIGKRLAWDSVFSDATALTDSTTSISHHTTLAIGINNHYAWQLYAEQTSRNDHDFSQLDTLIVALAQLNSDYLPDYQPSVAALHKALFAAVHLLANGTVIPQIVQLDNGKFSVRWLPATLDANAKRLQETLAEALDFDVLFWQEAPKRRTKTSATELPNTRQSLANQAQELLSLFITTLMNKLAKAGDDPFEALFFNRGENAFNAIGEAATADGIQAWLSRYYLSTQRYQPVVIVNESRNHKSFKVTLSIADSQTADALPVPLATVLNDDAYQDSRMGVLQSLSLLSAFIDGVDDVINSGGDKAIRYDSDKFAAFLLEIIPAIRLLSIQTLLPKSLQELLRPKVSVKLSSASPDDSAGFFGFNDLIHFDWQVAVGDSVISPQAFEALVENATGLLHYKGQYLYVDEGDLTRLQKQLTTAKTPTSAQLLQAALSESYDGAPVKMDKAVRELIQRFSAQPQVSLPNDLQATLRPYQERGYAWMLGNAKIGFGSIIADDMGLGKTLQVIAVMQKLKQDGALNAKHKALVVVPTGLLTNWQAEIGKFAPSLSCDIFHGSQRDIKTFDADVMLTTYGVLRSDAKLLKKIKWQLFAIDEAQHIKNPNAAQSKAVKSIAATIRIAMSGTPVENRLSEFWSIMDFTNKGYLGTLKQFTTDYANPIQVSNDAATVDKFRRITAPFMLRRMKSDKSIISDLPDKIEQNQLAVLEQKQAALYEKTVRDAMAVIESVDTSDNASKFERQGMILQMILALKQICNHPTNYLKNNKVDANLSGKTQLLLTLLDGIVESGEKVLIFTQFREMGELLQTFIAQRFGEEPMFYHGGCSVKQRQAMVERFQHNRADNIFILSLKAAGTGLNLTAASHVIHYDLWWNPAVENQATDRAYRIGQQKNVQVHRLITQNTFEEKIDAMIQHKKQLAEMTVSTGENWIGKLSNKELRDIFG